MKNDVLRVFGEFGRSLERTIESRPGSSFAALARDALVKAALAQRLNPQDVLAAAIHGDLPDQVDPHARFAEPPITVFRTKQFYVDINCWQSATTSVHQHGFSGAFQVLAGSSIQHRFAFEVEAELDLSAQIGRLMHAGVDLCRPGDIFNIEPGRAFIHSLFHLENPSLTIVVRSYDVASDEPQWTYLPPGLAVDEFALSAAQRRKVDTLSVLKAMSHERADAELVSLLTHGPASLSVLCARRGHAMPAFSQLVACRFGERAAASIEEALGSLTRARVLQRRRERVFDPELRLFLALLLHAPDGRWFRSNFQCMADKKGYGSSTTDLLLRLAELGESPLKLTHRHRPIVDALLSSATGERKRRESERKTTRERLDLEGHGRIASQLLNDPYLGVLFRV